MAKILLLLLTTQGVAKVHSVTLSPAPTPVLWTTTNMAGTTSCSLFHNAAMESPKTYAEMGGGGGEAEIVVL